MHDIIINLILLQNLCLHRRLHRVRLGWGLRGCMRWALCRSLGRMRLGRRFRCARTDLTLTSTHIARGLLAERTLLLAPFGEFAVFGVCVRKCCADAVVVLGGEVRVEIFVHATAAGVVCEGNERAILICIEAGGVRQFTDAGFVGGKIFVQQGLALFFGNRWVDVVAVFFLGTVVAIAWILLARF